MNAVYFNLSQGSLRLTSHLVMKFNVPFIVSFYLFIYLFILIDYKESEYSGINIKNKSTNINNTANDEVELGNDRNPVGRLKNQKNTLIFNVKRKPLMSIDLFMDASV